MVVDPKRTFLESFVDALATQNTGKREGKIVVHDLIGKDRLEHLGQIRGRIIAQHADAALEVPLAHVRAFKHHADQFEQHAGGENWA